MGGTGNKKSSKKNQPKRIRYNAENRGKKNKIKRLKKHLAHYSNDQVATVAYEKLYGDVVEKVRKRLNG